MQEILPTLDPIGLISPAVLGELSRRLPSDWDVQNSFPIRNGLVGNSRMRVFPFAVSAEFLNPLEFTGLRKTSKTLPCLVTNAPAFRSWASTQIFPNTSRAMPSPPSRIGWVTKTLLRQSVLGVNVVAQPVGLLSFPYRSNSIFHNAPRAVSILKRTPSLLNAKPFATRGWEPNVLAAL